MTPRRLVGIATTVVAVAAVIATVLLLQPPVEGPLAADALRALPAFTSFPDDYRTFLPDGRIWPEGAAGSR